MEMMEALRLAVGDLFWVASIGLNVLILYFLIFYLPSRFKRLRDNYDDTVALIIKIEGSALLLTVAGFILFVPIIEDRVISGGIILIIHGIVSFNCLSLVGKYKEIMKKITLEPAEKEKEDKEFLNQFHSFVSYPQVLPRLIIYYILMAVFLIIANALIRLELNEILYG